MTSKDKIQSLIGFAIKSGNIIFGLDNILRYKHKKYLIIACHTASQNALDKCKNQCSKIPLIISKKILIEDIVGKLNCKIIAITDKQMADAMLKYINLDNYALGWR